MRRSEFRLVRGSNRLMIGVLCASIEDDAIVTAQAWVRFR